MSGSESAGTKRKRSRSPPPWHKSDSNRQYRSRDAHQNRDQGNKPRWSHKDQMRINQLQEDERMREWVSKEDDFVLRQAKRKAEIRIKEGRAKSIDWLAITLRVLDPTQNKNPLDDEVQEEDLDYVDPDSVFDNLDETQLSELSKDIETYSSLESNSKNRDYWRTMQIICKDRQKRLRNMGSGNRAVNSVSSDIDRLLGPKTYEELEALEKQIRSKLDSNEPIDTDYWQQLLDNLLIWKAKAKLKKVYQAVLDSRLQKLRQESEQEAIRACAHLSSTIDGSSAAITYSRILDPEPSLQVAAKDKSLEVVDENQFLRNLSIERSKILKMGYVPSPKSSTSVIAQKTVLTTNHPSNSTKFASEDHHSQASKSLFDREVAKGVAEDEEIFAGEETISSADQPATNSVWSSKYRPRKPKYFNRVQMGYEWNKYNQTHYDHDNPPPKVVQGYKFHIFYPDLIDPTKAPTYKILREGGRKKGQTMAPAGEDDTCIIRFMSGPPYEDIAFRIADRDWDYSARHDRGFKSTFEKGILTLHFSFKKIYYRK